MAVNYDNKKFTEVETDKKAALSELDQTFGEIIGVSDSYFQEQIDASKNYAKEQKKNQQELTDFTIEKIEQQKDQAKKDYLQEQSAAYTDWKKQSNPYGANAEQMASMGMTATGYSESSQVSMYNTHQQRVAAARESYNQAVLNYNNLTNEAILQNNSALAEIAYNALQQQLELSLQGFQYKNSLVLAKAKEKREVNAEYYNRWKDVLSQINTENALAEQKRQFDEQMKFEKEKFDYQEAQATINKSTNSSSKKSTYGDTSAIEKATSTYGVLSSPSKEKASTDAMSRYEWNKLRNLYIQTGNTLGGNAVKNYASYDEYMEAYFDYVGSDNQKNSQAKNYTGYIRLKK